ncbi:hypothetical protein MATL_G00250810 [Megalops atlanticus]|uniref:Condensin-2 complex subunit H2 n=1 Tax=Megalops atlanticus TaxID=7932 RepID=A0A9D3PCX6_MEGAT|nr:hypothetical protein MATL_G00250810 [Megalops atlanticus]
MDASETRFTHLLQPIRDLTRNWEVDVASQLGEYLDELDQICISFDGGKTTMNFAEAALLIQGSACVYSKKVEYLYSLVYQALDFISNKKRDKQPTSIEQDGMDRDATFGSKRDKTVFLTLDDVSEKSCHIELRDDTVEGFEIIPLAPEPLIAVEEQEKKKNPLQSHRSEVLASCRDFRMNNFTPHKVGILHLDLFTSTPLFSVKDLQSQFQNISALTGVPEDASVNDRPLLPLNLSKALDDWGVAVGCDGQNDADEVFLPLEEVEGGMDLDPAPDEHIERQQQGPSDRRLLRERPAVQPAPDQQKEVPDPWRCFNLFSVSEDRPLKTGKHFTIPPSIQEVSGNKRKRRGTCKLQGFMKWFTGTLLEKSYCKPKKGPTFADVEALYWSNMKERLKSHKNIQRRGEACSDALEQRNLELEHAEVEREADEQDGQPEDFLELGAGGDDFSDHEALPDNGPAEIPEEQDLVITDSQFERMTYEDLVKKSVELFLVNSQKYAQETVLSRRIKDWEEMMGPQLTSQEERPTFDIHDYGNKIMDAFRDVRERRTFASIVQGKENHEVCRYMLASLQLANDYTVEIHRQDGLEEAIDTMELTLLSKQKVHERFKTYTAPSLADAH